MFAAALAIVLGDYPAEIVNYASDPRTGVISEFPMGLPSVGQIKQFLDGVQTRKDRLKHYDNLPPAVPRLPRPPAGHGALANVFVPPDAPQYERMVEMAKTGDPRAWRRDATRPGIWVALGWLEKPATQKMPQPLPDIIAVTPELARWADEHRGDLDGARERQDGEAA